MDTYYHSSCESLQYHRIQYIIVQFESIQFLEIATFLISLPLSKNHSSPSTLQKDSTQSGTDVHPSPFNQAQSRENPNASQPTDLLRSERASGRREWKGANKLPEQTRRISSSY